MAGTNNQFFFLTDRQVKIWRRNAARVILFNEFEKIDFTESFG